MIPVWLKNKKTGGYDRIPYDLMLGSGMTRNGRQVWYVHTLNLQSMTSAYHDIEMLNEFRILHQMLDQHPEYFLKVLSGTYLFTGKKWGMMDRLMSYVGAWISHENTTVYILGVLWAVSGFILLSSVVILLYHLLFG